MRDNSNKTYRIGSWMIPVVWAVALLGCEGTSDHSSSARFEAKENVDNGSGDFDEPSASDVDMIATQCEVPLQWDDEDVRIAVEQELKLPVEAIGIEQLRQLTALRIPPGNAHKLTVVACMSNLQTLIVGANHIVDLSPIAELPALRELEIRHNLISDITPILKPHNSCNCRKIDIRDNLFISIDDLIAMRENYRHCDMILYMDL